MKLKTISCEKYWRVYCPFCDQDISPNDGEEVRGWFFCNWCPTKTKFIVSGSFSSPEIIFIQYLIDDYVIEICLNKPDLQLFHKSEIPISTGVVFSRELVYKLNHIPPINPTNAKEWLNKLLNLKAFS